MTLSRSLAAMIAAASLSHDASDWRRPVVTEPKKSPSAERRAKVKKARKQRRKTRARANN